MIMLEYHSLYAEEIVFFCQLSKWGSYFSLVKLGNYLAGVPRGRQALWRGAGRATGGMQSRVPANLPQSAARSDELQKRPD
jgi:hypothetical protein